MAGRSVSECAELGTRGLTHVYSKDNFFYPVQYGGERGVIGIRQ